ncbi:MAG: hypothetical protein R6U19_04850, partial [Bacteroidales bacterium]
MTKMVFIGFSHRPKDPRLFFREMRFLKTNIKDIDLYFLKDGRLASYEDILAGRAPESNEKERFWRISDRLPRFMGGLLRGIVYKIFQAIFFVKNLSVLYKAKPEVVQASDAREIKLALMAKLCTGARAVYDSHEDYYNQVFEYRGRTARAFLKALPHKVNEILLLRFFDSVFCTDDYLFGEYQKTIYGCGRVFLLRNYPLIGDLHAKVLYAEKASLDLVYIGGVNKYRGLKEAAMYVQKFNESHFPSKTITLTIYSDPNKLVEEISKNNSVYYKPWIDYNIMLETLKNYDVGICLWKNITKLQRNIP